MGARGRSSFCKFILTNWLPSVDYVVSAVVAERFYGGYDSILIIF